MARPEKRNYKLSYFQHDVTRGKTVTILRGQFGNDGYAFWFGLLEMLGNCDGAYIDLNEIGALEYLSAWCGVTDEQALKMLDLLANLQAIDADLYKKQNKIWIQKFVDRMSHLNKRRNYTPVRPDGVSKPIQYQTNGVKEAVEDAEVFEPDFKAIEKEHPMFDAEKAWKRFKEWNEAHDKKILKINWETWMEEDLANGKYKKKADPNRMITLECPACDSRLGVKFKDRNKGYYCKDEDCGNSLAYGNTLIHERAYYEKQRNKGVT
tara:strand:- start:958 stop:1752 length:795 start_codon:yes stop_codon:yes gene_type:complete